MYEDVAIARLRKRGTPKEKFEEIEDLRKLSLAYLDIWARTKGHTRFIDVPEAGTEIEIKGDKLCRIDASKSKKAVAQQAIKAINEVLGL